jgi:hypothetical protein
MIRRTRTRGSRERERVARHARYARPAVAMAYHNPLAAKLAAFGLLTVPLTDGMEAGSLRILLQLATAGHHGVNANFQPVSGPILRRFLYCLKHMIGFV